MGKFIKILLITGGVLTVLTVVVIIGAVIYIWKSMPDEIKMFYKATIEYQQGNYEEAVRIYDDILENNPEFADAWKGKGEALEAQEKYEEALACYDKGLEYIGEDAIAQNT